MKTEVSIPVGLSHVARQLAMMLHTSRSDDGCFARFTVDPQLTILPDPFQNGPILPGVCLVQAVMLAVAQARNAQCVRMCEMKQAKFLRAALPGDQVTIQAQCVELQDGRVDVKAEMYIAEDRLAQVSLIAAFEESTISNAPAAGSTK